MLILTFNCIVFGFKCPTTNLSQPIDGTYRDLNYCGIYYICINGIPFIQTCPPGLHFHLKFESCEFTICVEPKFSDCHEIVSKNTNTKLHYIPFVNNENERNVADECEPNKNETVANFIDCRIYHHCVNGVGFAQKCPPGYFFSPKIDVQSCSTRVCVPWNEAYCAINGQWSSWSNWTECQGSCDAPGLRRRYRECNNPPPTNNGNDCVGDAVEEQLCDMDCSVTPSFEVSLYERYISPGLVNWTRAHFIRDKLYNRNTAKLDIKRIGIYLFALCATIEQRDNIRLSFSGAGLSVGLRRESSFIIDISLMREAIFKLSPIFTPGIQQAIPTNLISTSDGRETSWLGFKYETENYFFAATDRSVVSSGYVNLPIVQMRGFSQNGNQFKSTDPGFYYVSFGVGVPVSGNSLTVHIAPYPRSYRTIDGQNTEYIDTWTKNYILNSLQIAPEFGMYVTKGNLFSSSELQVYMTALKLNSSSPMMSIFSHQSIESSVGGLVIFQNIIIDNFNGWSWAGSFYKIPITGLYYISFNIPFCNYSGIGQITVHVNDCLKKYVIRSTSNTRYSQLVTGSILLNLKEGEKVSIKFVGCIRSDANEGVLNIFLVD